MTEEVSIPVQRLTRNLTVNVKVTGLRVWRARWWVARQLLLLAARVAGCGIHIEMNQ